MNENSAEFLEELRRVLDYNSETGVMTWKVSFGRKIKAGSLAGCINKNDGRIRICFKNKTHLAHRLAWLLTYGKWPEKVIDHVDGNPLNNRIDNLRDVPRRLNSQNQRRARCDNQTGLLGVFPYNQSGKFKARIGVNGKQKCLGIFLTAEEAFTAYLVAKRELHAGCTI